MEAHLLPLAPLLPRYIQQLLEDQQRRSANTVSQTTQPPVLLGYRSSCTELKASPALERPCYPDNATEEARANVSAKAVLGPAQQDQRAQASAGVTLSQP